ncbi:MAG: response regulator [Okeania sp. SIO3I5]|uniref:response regulator n=1 Tax=Okeania sp. SIO3I5 TaxID=2607805 RepID=UPI0013BA134B|nr:response regulator [Okeania sp. SIO3I5]NEQ40562.1 response regulator [Okeania sp. SIO3I5]
MNTISKENLEGIILIVDDNLSNLKILATLLKDNSYQVKKAIDGESALLSIETDIPDLILLDIKMPELDGYQVCERLKANPKTQEIPVIFISALNEVFDKVKAFEIGGIDYVTKPFQEEEVLARIKSQLTIQKQKRLLEAERQLLKIEQDNLKEEIRQRKEAEAILYQSRALISSILNSSLDGIAAMAALRDKRTGNIIDFSCLVVNPIIARAFNQEPQDLIGKLVIKKFLGRINYELFDDFVNVVETGKSLERDVYYNDQAEGKWYHFIAVKLGDGFAITVRDITERKNLELTLEETNKELEAFSYSVAHDLRNPLGNIESLIDWLQEEYENHNNPTQNSQKIFNVITESTARMQQIIKDLLLLSTVKKSAITLELMDLSNTVESILIKLHSNEPQRKVELVIQPKIIAKVDENFFNIALENLISNAWKYSSKKDVTYIEFGVLSAEQQNLEEIINQCSLYYKEKNLCEHKLDRVYFMKDNGAGFNMENVEELFTPFKRFHSDNEFQGFGIGLSIVKRIINRHQGLIWCSSEVEKGATFYFTLNDFVA